MNHTKIKFDRTWLKLKDRKIGDTFTTIRSYTYSKATYYKTHLNEIFDIVITNTRNGFKGIMDDKTYLILGFEVVMTGDVVKEAVLRDIQVEYVYKIQQ